MDDLFAIYGTRLDAAGIEYMITGSVAAMVYGEPRLTHDIDLVVAMPAGAIDRFAAQFPDEDFYCAPTEVIRVEAARRQRGHFNVIHHETGFKADIYLVGSDPLHAWAMARRRAIEVSGTTLSVAPPEYVILRKLEYYREGGSPKHVDDVRAMLRVAGERIDRDEISTRATAMGLGMQWDEVQAVPASPGRP